MECGSIRRPIDVDVNALVDQVCVRIKGGGRGEEAGVRGRIDSLVGQIDELEAGGGL